VKQNEKKKTKNCSSLFYNSQSPLDIMSLYFQQSKNSFKVYSKQLNADVNIPLFQTMISSEQLLNERIRGDYIKDLIQQGVTS